jgi:hypothetical protein
MQASVLQSQSSATAAPISETSRSTSQGILTLLISGRCRVLVLERLSGTPLTDLDSIVQSLQT